MSGNIAIKYDLDSDWTLSLKNHLFIYYLLICCIWFFCIMYLDSIHFREKIYGKKKTNEIWVTQNSAMMKKNVSFIIVYIEYAIVY